jgi:hypothetical protein
MFCHMCGQKLPENARFCSKCGTAVAQTSTAISEEHHSSAAASASRQTEVASFSRQKPAWLNRIGKKGTHITEEYLDKVYKEWSEVVLSALETGEMFVADSRDVANFLSARYDNIHTKEELGEVLNELKREWPMYEDLWVQFKT